MDGDEVIKRLKARKEKLDAEEKAEEKKAKSAKKSTKKSEEGVPE